MVHMAKDYFFNLPSRAVLFWELTIQQLMKRSKKIVTQVSNTFLILLFITRFDHSHYSIMIKLMHIVPDSWIYGEIDYKVKRAKYKMKPS